MSKRKIIYLLSALLIMSFQGTSQQIHSDFAHLFTPAKQYVIYKTNTAPVIDGKADEDSWQKAPWTVEFRDIEGDIKPIPTYRTRAKMLWDDKNLYIFAELEEPHIWAYYATDDMIVYHENDFEVFIDPDRDTHDYYEFELNAQNTLFDLVLDKPYRNGGRYDIKWNAKGFRSAIHLDGTLNDPSDKDEKWSVEMAIPFSSLTTGNPYIQPEDGSIWKINFSRVQWQTEINDGKYIKKKNKTTGKNLHEDNWVWSPQGVINMHLPERWALAFFSENAPGNKIPGFKVPLDEELSQHLWLLYYRQKEFIKKEGHYATKLKDLGLQEQVVHKGTSYQLELSAESKKFRASIGNGNRNMISIDEDGLIEIYKD